MKKINQLFEARQPFAVLQYFATIKSFEENAIQKFELMYENKGRNTSKTMDKEDVSYFLNDVSDKMKVVIDNRHGKVWEFNDFRNR
jgi:hypothetical protein